MGIGDGGNRKEKLKNQKNPSSLRLVVQERMCGRDFFLEDGRDHRPTLRGVAGSHI